MIKQFFSRRLVLQGVLIALAGASLMGCAPEVAHAQYPYGNNYQHRISNFRYQIATGVFVNGRQLSHHEVAQLRQVFGYVIPGSYWMTSDGTYGRVGGPAMGNLYAAARAAMHRGSRSSYHGGRSSRIDHFRDPTVVPGVGVILPGGAYTFPN